MGGLFDLSAKVKGGGAAFLKRKITEDMLALYIRQQAHGLAKMMKETIQQQGRPAGSFAPKSALTFYAAKYGGRAGTRRGSDKALVRSGTMLRAIQVISHDPLSAFIGIPRMGAMGRANIAAIHEFGADYMVTVTRKMLRYIMAVLVPAWNKGKKKAAGKGGGKGREVMGGYGSANRAGALHVGGQLHIRIPARPFIRPSMDAWVAGLLPAMAEQMKIAGFEKK